MAIDNPIKESDFPKKKAIVVSTDELTLYDIELEKSVHPNGECYLRFLKEDVNFSSIFLGRYRLKHLYTDTYVKSYEIVRRDL